MRDFRDAKAMAQTLRQALSDRSLTLSHSESLELIAKLFGLRDWNVLAARIEAEASGVPQSSAAGDAGIAAVPVIPMRDIVVFPEMTAPLYVGRAKTIRAIERAMAGDRRVLLVTQKRREDEDPGPDDLHRTGILAVILQALPLPDGTMKLLVHGRERAQVRQLTGGELLLAEAAPAEPSAADEQTKTLAAQALEAFARHAGIDLASPPQSMAGLAMFASYPARLADLIARNLSVSQDQAQDLLDTVDVAERLAKVLAIMEADRKAA